LRPLHGYEANEAIAFGYPREACVEQQALWLSATSAIINGGRRPYLFISFSEE
jgi:hypothetical protein